MLDRYHKYWQGKAPRVRKATEQFLRQHPEYLATKEPMPAEIRQVAQQCNISIGALTNHAKMIRYLYRVGAINKQEIEAKLNESA